MLIQVRYSTGKIKQVAPKKLQQLIVKRKIVQFMRSSGWVTVGYDPVRQTTEMMYAGQDRRN